MKNRPYIKAGRGLIYFFICSHILGWTIAWLQTLWIVFEIKKIKKLMNRFLERVNNNNVTRKHQYQEKTLLKKVLKLGITNQN